MKISIIIPVYNSEKFIDRCLTSILNQTYKDYEIILINDGSTDSSLQILRKYEKNYDFVKVYSQKNHGISYTRNKGIDKAKGEYIIFIDNDDWIDKDYLEKYINYIEENNFDIVCGGYKRTTNTDVLFEKNITSLDDVYKYLAPWAKIYKKSIIKDNNIKFLDFSIGEDVYFNILYYDKIKNFGIINYNGYNWYNNEDSFSNSIQKKELISPLYLLDQIYNNINEKNKFEFFFIFYVNWYLSFAPFYKKKEFIKIYKQLYNWIEKRYPKYKKNKKFNIHNNDDKLPYIFAKVLFLSQKLKLDTMYIVLFKTIFSR